MTDTPRFTVLLGRGDKGKSTVGAYLAETALGRGAEFLIGNMDPMQAHIAEPFPDEMFVSPEEPDDESRAGWLTHTLETEVIGKRRSLLLDTAGNDSLIPWYAAQFSLVDVLEEAGVEPVAIHVLGPDPADLVMLQKCEEARFAPKRTVLALNAARIGRSHSAFDVVRGDKSYQAAVARGAKEITIPRLGGSGSEPMPKIRERHMQFSKAAEAGAKAGLSPFDIKLVTMWLKAMDQVWGPVGEVL